MNIHLKKNIKKGLQIILWTFVFLLSLVVLLALLIQISPIQNKIRDELVSYFKDKTDNEISIGRLDIELPGTFALEKVYIESQEKDTLFYGENLSVNLNLLLLLNNTIQINDLELSGIHARIKRNKEGVFNYDYLIKAFASTDTTVSDSEPMAIRFGRINLDKIKLNYQDTLSKNDLVLSFNHFDTEITKFDLAQLAFEIPKIKMEGLNLKLKQGLIAYNTKTKPVDEAGPPMKIKLGRIDLSKLNIHYEQEENQINSKVSLKRMILRMNLLDLANQNIDMESLEINGMKGGLILGKLQKKEVNLETKAKTGTENEAWKIKLNQADLKLIDFKFDDSNSLALTKGIDYKHLDIRDFNLDAEKLKYSSTTVSATIYAFKVREKSGLNIQSLKTEFYYGPKSAFLKKLYLKTPQSILQDEISLGYTSVESISTNSGALKIDASIKGSEIGFKDILLFQPDLANTNPFKSNPNAILKVGTEIKGSLNEILVSKLEVSGLGKTKIIANGQIIGLPDAKNAYFDWNIQKLESTAKDIKGIVPTGTIENTIQLPQQLSLNGSFKGRINDFFTNLNLNSSFGKAQIKANFNQTRKNKESYEGEAYLNNFDIGKLIKDQSIGKISIRAKLRGSGLNPKTINANMSAKLIRANYNKYNYENGVLQASITNGVFKANLLMRDPNLSFDLATNGSFQDKFPAVKLKLNVDIADIEKLNLHAGTLKLRGQIDADLINASLDYLNGNLNLRNLEITNPTGEFKIDSVHIKAFATADIHSITLSSSFVDAELRGKYTLSQLANSLSCSVSKYYDLKLPTRKTSAKPQQFAFNLALKNNPIILQLLPEIKGLEPISIQGRYNSVNDTIVLEALVPKLIYNTYSISQAQFKIEKQENALAYSLLVNKIETPSFNLPHTELTGKIENNKLDYSLQLKDSEEKEQYLIGGTLQNSNSNTKIKLDDRLVLNYEDWKMDSDNLIQLSKNGIQIKELVLENGAENLSVRSETEIANAPLLVKFENFKIETLTSLIEKDSLVLGGTINGRARIQNATKSPLFTSALEISDFSFKKDSIGNLSIRVNNEIASLYQAEIVLSGSDNKVGLLGTFNAKNSQFDFDLNIDRLNMKSIQPFSLGKLSESSGFLSGKFEIKGTAKAPEVLGNLKFNTVAFREKQLNSYFKSINDKIVINKSGIRFDTFSISDSKDNILVVDGLLKTTNYSDFGFDLTIKADNFRALNSKAKDNELYFGELYLSSRLMIKGDLNQPIVEGIVKINKDTKFTVVLPQNDPSVADREGIIEFVDSDQPQTSKPNILAESIRKTQLTGIDASVNIEIDKEANLNMILDKTNGDYIKMQGEASLNGGIDPSGKTSLSGRYDFSGGTYEMTFNLLKRKFDIKAGSYIQWTGEPTAADMNITAIYKTETAPIDLVSNQLVNETQEVRNTYKQRIPFETELILKGDLMRPDIRFDIVLPEGINTASFDQIQIIETKLAQLRLEPTELNKQVFAILLLNRFIGENPFSSDSGGTSTESLARQSASKVLSQQMNNLAGDLIKGVDLNFNLDATEDYSSGNLDNRTDLNVGLSKKLLNDRLKVTVGSSFGLEGQERANQETNTIAGDIAVEYQLSEDGKYRVRAYRINQYQVALQGQVIETGVAFVITMDYNKFSELFQKAKKEKVKIEKKEIDSKND